MANYRYRPVVIDHRRNTVAHYGSTIALEAKDLVEARAEVDKMPPEEGVNCGQILDESGSVASHRLVNDVAWS
jgi:hypothetical protein